jgi:predicted Zn finger-like uncharacterized protein
MSLITRCPACGTLFKVVPDQLRISEGWVRCGHCAEVFDATLHLQADSAEPEPAGRVAARPAEPADVAAEALEPEPFASSLNTESGEGSFFEGPDSAQIEAEAQALAEHPLDRPFELRRRDLEGEIEHFRPLKGAFEPQSELEPESRTDEDAALQDVSFVREARRKAFWGGPRARAALSLAGLALGILLALQIAMHERDRLAAALPQLRSWLDRLCEPLACRVAAPRQIDSIAIDSSSFNQLRGDAYRLNVTVKNQAAIQVAMPALELTLTDGQDQPVLRRVLMPADFAPGAGVIPAASEWSGSLGVAVAANGAGTRIAGYRLLAFYP